MKEEDLNNKLDLVERATLSEADSLAGCYKSYDAQYKAHLSTLKVLHYYPPFFSFYFHVSSTYMSILLPW